MATLISRGGAGSSQTGPNHLACQLLRVDLCLPRERLMLNFAWESIGVSLSISCLNIRNFNMDNFSSSDLQ